MHKNVQAALLRIAKNYKQPKFPSIAYRINKLSIHKIN